MNRVCILVLTIMMVSTTLSAQLHPDYENPEVFERNQVSPHATLMPYASMEQALVFEPKSSPFHLSLNGNWQFHLADNPGVAPGDFYKKSFDRSGWKEIPVPSNWQMEGFGVPIFRNIGLPHPLAPPEVPEKFNPTGSYYRTFEIPENWDNRQVFLHFEGVHSASYVWVNGKEVGYNQGGMEPAEYDITSLLKKGKNSLAVKVLRYSDGSYLEDQDTWRLSGIYRDVYLISAPEVHIHDLYVTTDLDDEYRDATLRVEAHVEHYGRGQVSGHSLRSTLFDQNGKAVPGGAAVMEMEDLSANGETVLDMGIKIQNPLKWSAEYPHLYTVVLELLDSEKRVVEVLSSRVGFREVEVIGQAICVNGVPIKFNGVNSHMLHPETGHTMDVETIRRDFYLMKQFNINCVRTSHYPPNVEYLDLADEIGIYIIDETGDEAHAYIELSHNPLWREQYLDRMRKMVYRDRNHPSIVMWSAGNESGPGDNICALIAEGKLIDPSRPAWMYGGNRDEDPLTNPIRCEDVVGPRYLQPLRLQQRFGKSDDPRPSFMDEYIAVTGNSLGGLDEYWELIRRYPRLTGGAIWDWMSPGITMPVIVTRDDSPSDIRCVLMNKARLVPGKEGEALYLSGNDDWLEITRDPLLDISGEALTLSFLVKPEPYNGNAAYLTKGDYQFGIVQPDADHLEFYLNTGRKVSLTAALPEDWLSGWHHVAATYDGTEMVLYVDETVIGTVPNKGSIINAPYQVILGKSAELRDSHQGYMCSATLDNVRIFDSVVPVSQLNSEDRVLKPASLLWLDFETTQEEGTYYSVGIPGRTYGVVWPDRTIQPELWQLKKSPQPVSFVVTNMEAGEVEITNHHHFKNLDELDFRWELTANGEMVQQGKLDLEVASGEKKLVQIPIDSRGFTPGITYHLLISGATKEDFPWAKAGHEVAWEQFTLPFFKELPLRDEGAVAPEMNEDSQKLVISGETFAYTFDKTSGVLNSMLIEGEELVKRGLKFNVWRAPLANDLDSWNFWHTEMGHVTEGMGRETANGWRSIGLDRLVQDVDGFSSRKLESAVVVDVEATVHAMNYATGFKVYYEYTIEGDGEIEVKTTVSSRGNMTKWIPKVGLQMELPYKFQQLEWFGRGPFENYPDRKTGAKTGRYKSTVEDAYVPYIIPQDYGNRSDVHWVRISSDSGRGIQISGDELFNMSAQKYSTDNLDRAHYTFQLKDEKLVTLNLDHQVSGVGGTANSVLNPYRVAPGEFEFTFTIKPLTP